MNPGCSGKAAYQSPQEAHSQIAMRKKRHHGKNVKRDGRGIQQTYRCDNCGLWHIGSSSHGN